MDTLSDHLSEPCTADEAWAEAAKCDRHAAILTNAGEDDLAGEMMAEGKRLYELAMKLERKRTNV